MIDAANISYRQASDIKDVEAHIQATTIVCQVHAKIQAQSSNIQYVGVYILQNAWIS